MLTVCKLLRHSQMMKMQRLQNLSYFGFSSEFQAKNQQRRILCNLAMKTINIIKEGQSIEEYSLRDRILKEILADKEAKQEANLPARNEFMKLFTTGVQLNPEIYSQQRVQNENKQWFEVQKYTVIFYPTNFITSRMFNLIQQYKNKRILIAGQFGLSKTFSSILYSLLTNYVVDYRLHCSEPEKLSDQILKIQKTFYWSLDLEKYKDEYEKKQTIQLKFIKQNCEEIKDFNQTFKNEYLIEDFYKQRKIKVRYIIDQINTLASTARRISKGFIQKGSIQQKVYQLVKKRVHSCVLGRNSVFYLSSVNFNESGVLQQLDLNATRGHQSIDIHEVDFFKMKLKNQEQYFKEMIDFYTFQIGQRIKSKDNSLPKDWFFRTEDEYFELRKNLRKELFEQLLKYQNKVFLSPLSIRRLLQLNKNEDMFLTFNNLSQTCVKYFQNSMNNLQTDLKNKLQKFIRKQGVASQQKFNRYKIIQQIYQKSIQNIKKIEQAEELKQKQNQVQKDEQKKVKLFTTQSQNTNHVEISTNQISVDVDQLYVIDNASSSKQSNRDKQLFFYDSKNQKIVLYHSPYILNRILKNYESEIFDYIITDEKTIYQQTKDPKFLGTKFEYFFLRMCQNKDYLLQLNFKYNQAFDFMDNQVYPFKPIPKKAYQTNSLKKDEVLGQNKTQKQKQNKKKSKNMMDQAKEKDQNTKKTLQQYSLINQLKNPINQLVSNFSNKYKQQSSILCIPCINSKNSNVKLFERDQNSKHIDFIILKSFEDEDKNIIQIWLFDVSTSNSKYTINDKKNKFQEDFDQFKKNQKAFQEFQVNKQKLKFEFKFKYIVIGNAIDIKSQIKKKDDILQIGHCVIKDIKFYKKENQISNLPSNQQQTVFKFEILKRIIMKKFRLK